MLCKCKPRSTFGHLDYSHVYFSETKTSDIKILYVSQRCFSVLELLSYSSAIPLQSVCLLNTLFCIIRHPFTCFLYGFRDSRTDGLNGWCFIVQRISL